MATRTISTKLAIEGESEYRASLKKVNAEIRALQSELKLTESQYQNNANTITALTAKGDALNNLFKTQQGKVDELRAALENARKAEEEYSKKKDEISAKIAENNKKLEELKNTTGDTAEEENKLTEENRELNKQLETNEAYLAAASKGVHDWQTDLTNAEIKLNDLDAQIQLNNEYLQEAENSTDGCATSIDRFGKRVENSKDALTELSAALVASGIKKGLNEIREALEGCSEASTNFETAMAGVKRTVGGSDEFIAALGERFKQLSTEMPITAAELASIAMTAGQLGIAQDDVESFTTVMAQLATTTDLTADNAATMLAQFSNITGVTDFERLGSTVADLGDATATTASKVVDMSQGMAAAASVAGMSAKDILAISASVGSLGIEAQAGSTAMQTLISTLYKATETGNKLDEFAAVAGMSASEFKAAWGEDAAGALNTFIQGLNDTERNGKSAIVVLDELGISNARQTKAILGLAEAGSLLGNSLAQADAAWESNTALGDKAAIMYNTTEAAVTRFNNSVEGLQIAVGDKLNPALKEFAESGTSAVEWATDFVEKNQSLVPVIAATTAGLGVFAAGAGIAAIATSELGKAIAAATAAAAANPWLLAASAVVALGTAFITLSANAKASVPDVKDLTTEAQDLHDTLNDVDGAFADSITTIQATQDTALGYVDALAKMREAGVETEAEQRLYHDTLVKLTQTVPELSQYIDLQTDSYLVSEDAIRAHIVALMDEAKAQAYTEHITNLLKKRVDAEIELKTREIELEDATSKYNDTAGKLTKQLAEGRISTELYEAEIADARKEMDTYQIAVDESKAALDEYDETIDVTKRAISELTGIELEELEATEQNAGAKRSAIDANNDMQSALSELSKKYSEAKNSAYESIKQQVGLWETMDTSFIARRDPNRTHTARCQPDTSTRSTSLMSHNRNSRSMTLR